MNNGFVGFGAPQGAVPGMGATQSVKVNSWLEPETIDSLKQKTEGFTLSVSEQEIARARCNHREKNGMPSIIPQEDGSCRCLVCGYTFMAVNQLSQEEVKAACDVIENILQTIKLMYISLDAEDGRMFFQILAFMRKIPQLWKIAKDDFSRYENVYGFTQNVPPSAFSVFGSLTNPGFGFGGFNNNQNMAWGGPQMPQQTPQGWGGAQPMQNGYPFNQMPQQTPQGWGGAQPMQNGPWNGMPSNGGVYQGNGQPMGNPMYAGGMIPGGPGYPQGQQMQPNNGGFSLNPTGAAEQQPSVEPPKDSNPAVGADFKAK